MNVQIEINFLTNLTYLSASQQLFRLNRAIRDYIQSLHSINEYIYEDEENRLTMLHLAVGLESNYREQVIEILLENRADVNCAGRSEDVDDVRPLHMAAMWGYDLTVKLLLYEGADATLRDSNGHSAIDYASMYDNHLCVSLLLCYGSLNATTSAWEEIINSSLTDSVSETSFENCYNSFVIEEALRDRDSQSIYWRSLI